MIKILMPATHYYPVIGGIEMWTKNIAERISEKAEVFIVTGKISGQSRKETLRGVKIWRTSFFSLTNLSASPLIYTLSLLPFVFFKSLYLVKKEKIDILHCQGFLSGFLGFLLSKLAGIPYIVTVQRLEGKRNPLKKLVYKKAAVCIVASNAIKKIFEEMGVKNIEVIPNGIDLKRFKNLERRPHEGFVVMTVARLEKVKGVEYLIKAMSSYQLSAISCQLLVIGDGSERKNLEKLVRELNLEEKVRFLGEIPNEKIPEYLAAADCFVLPSLKEGFGIAILEAMAAKVPVIATRVGGILDLIEDQKTGILVEPGDPDEIAQAILKIYMQPELKDKLINSAIAELKHYDWQNIASRVYETYKNCLSRRDISS